MFAKNLSFTFEIFFVLIIRVFIIYILQRGRIYRSNSWSSLWSKVRCPDSFGRTFLGLSYLFLLIWLLFYIKGKLLKFHLVLGKFISIRGRNRGINMLIRLWSQNRRLRLLNLGYEQHVYLKIRIGNSPIKRLLWFFKEHIWLAKWHLLHILLLLIIN